MRHGFASHRSISSPSPSALVLVLTGLLLTGCNGAFWGNLLVLGITVGIFFGTLALGRASAPTRSGAEASSSTQSGGRGPGTSGR